MTPTETLPDRGPAGLCQAPAHFHTPCQSLREVSPSGNYLVPNDSDYECTAACTSALLVWDAAEVCWRGEIGCRGGKKPLFSNDVFRSKRDRIRVAKSNKTRMALTGANATTRLWSLVNYNSWICTLTQIQAKIYRLLPWPVPQHSFVEKSSAFT